MTDDVHVLEAPRGRAAPYGRTAAVAAKSLAAVYRPRLAEWNARLANLRARAIRLELTFVRTEARTVLVQVIAARRQFAATNSDADDAVRSHSLIRDVDRALCRLDEELRALGNVKSDPSS